MKLTPRIQNAIYVAAKAHAGQTRKDGETPYITHPYSVAVILSEFTGDEDLLCAALLHDVLEDAPDMYSVEKMKKDFGEQVYKIVSGVTEDKSIEDWVERKDAYREKLEKASDGSIMLSAADLTHNLNNMIDDAEKFGPDFIGKFAGDSKQRHDSYVKRIDVIRSRINGPLLDQLETALDRYDNFIKG